MPVKRRVSKRRLSPEDEMKAWSELFDVGYDFFQDLELLGLSEREARAAAPEAWRRLGHLFLDQWKPTDARAVPWALEEFGEPRCR
jgi:hypothetical protein